LLDRGWGKPTQPLAGDADEPPIAISNEERREQARVLVAKAFAQVTEDNPELARQEAKYQPPAPSSSVPSASIEPPGRARCIE